MVYLTHSRHSYICGMNAFLNALFHVALEGRGDLQCAHFTDEEVEEERPPGALVLLHSLICGLFPAIWE